MNLTIKELKSIIEGMEARKHNEICIIPKTNQILTRASHQAYWEEITER